MDKEDKRHCVITKVGDETFKLTVADKAAETVTGITEKEAADYFSQIIDRLVPPSSKNIINLDPEKCRQALRMSPMPKFHHVET